MKYVEKQFIITVVRSMSLLGDEFQTEFGEYINFETDMKGEIEFHEEFEEFVSLSQIPNQNNDIVQRIQQITQEIKG